MDQAQWKYDRAEGRFKHCWKNDWAGFVPSGRGEVGKCHASITDEIACDLLRNGVVYNAPGTDEPEHVYAVYRGVIYEAAPTTPGVSFHGYPWSLTQGRGELPPRIRREMERRADECGDSGEFKKWLKVNQ